MSESVHAQSDLAPAKVSDSYVYGTLGFLALIWGSAFILIKYGLTVMSPVQLGSLRILIGFAVLLPVAIPRMGQATARDWRYLILCGFFGNLIPSLLFSIAGGHLNSSVSGSLNANTPIFTFIVSTIVASRRPTWQAIGGLVLGFSGALLLSMRNGFDLNDINLWALCIIAATMCYACHLNIVKYYLGHLNGVTVSSCGMVGAGIASLLIFSFSDGWHTLVQTAPSNPYPFLGIIALGAIGSGWASVLFNKLIRATSAVIASLVTFIIPIVAIAWGLFDGEAFGLMHVLGTIFILISLLILRKAQ